MPMLKVNGASIHYRLDGPPGAPGLVLLNSMGADLGMWEPLMPALSARHRVLRHDVRGHGHSQAAPGPYSIELLAQDVVELIGLTGLTRPHLCGLSLGGMVAMWLAARMPGLLSTLIVCNTAARMPRPEAYEERSARVRAGGVEAVADTIVALWFSAPFRGAHPEVLERAREMILGTSQEGYLGACAAVRAADLRGIVSGITVPTLVMASTFDVATPPSAAAFLVEAIPGARYLELPVGHLSALEAGPALAGRILSFLEEAEAGVVAREEA